LAYSPGRQHEHPSHAVVDRSTSILLALPQHTIKSIRFRYSVSKY
jgi:hypothetical protein